MRDMKPFGISGSPHQSLGQGPEKKKTPVEEPALGLEPLEDGYLGHRRHEDLGTYNQIAYSAAVIDLFLEKIREEDSDVMFHW